MRSVSGATSTNLCTSNRRSATTSARGERGCRAVRNHLAGASRMIPFPPSRMRAAPARHTRTRGASLDLQGMRGLVDLALQVLVIAQVPHVVLLDHADVDVGARAQVVEHARPARGDMRGALERSPEPQPALVAPGPARRRPARGRTRTCLRPVQAACESSPHAAQHPFPGHAPDGARHEVDGLLLIQAVPVAGFKHGHGIQAARAHGAVGQ